MGVKCVYTNGFTPIPVKSFVFSGGEVQVQVEKFPEVEVFVQIEAHITSSNDVMELIMLVDILRRNYGKGLVIKLLIPYLPYARQDRAMVRGEALGVRAFANIINSLDFDAVTVWDVHSDVALGVLNNSFNIPIENIITRDVIRDAVLVSPDAGSLKKVSKVAQTFGRKMIRADKTRSVVDGSITGTKVFGESISASDKDFLIVDDICDGGRTFIELAKELRKYIFNDDKIRLYVTHGIFSKGLDVFNGIIDEVCCALPFPGVDLKHPLLKVVHG